MAEHLLKCPECGNTEPADFRVFAEVAFAIQDDGTLYTTDQDFGVVGECQADVIECQAENCGYQAEGRVFV